MTRKHQIHPSSTGGKFRDDDSPHPDITPYRLFPASSVSFPCDLAPFQKAWAQAPLVVNSFVPASQVNRWISLADIGSRISDHRFLALQETILRIADISRNRRASNRQTIIDGMKDGMSLQVRELERVMPPSSNVVRLGRQLEQQFGHPLDSATLFITPPRDPALPRHVDATEVFVLQVAGSKAWDVGDISFEMSPGDMAYIPAGTPHQVTPIGSQISISISYILQPIRAFDVISHFLGNTELPAHMSRTLPPLNSSTQHSTLRYLLENALQSLNSRSTFEAVAFQLSLVNRSAPAVDFKVLQPADLETEFMRNSEVDVLLERGTRHITVLVQGGASLRSPFFVEQEVLSALESQKPFTAVELARNLSSEQCLQVLVKLNEIGALVRVARE